MVHWSIPAPLRLELRGETSRPDSHWAMAAKSLRNKDSNLDERIQKSRPAVKDDSRNVLVRTINALK